MEFTITDTAEIQKVEMKDDVPIGRIIINKKGEFLSEVSWNDMVAGAMDSIWGYVTGSLKDVTFEIYAREDIKAADGESDDYYKKDELVATIKTDELGIARTDDLPLGKYYVVEKETADGFVLDGEPRDIDLTYRDQDTPVVTFDSEWQNSRQKAKVIVTKKEKDSDRVLEGGVFALCAKEDMADVELTSVDWLWFPYIPFGKLTIIQGNPGEGKTYFAMRLAAACTNRKPLPGMETLEPFNIIYQTAEDGLGDTVKPRLMEAEADLERVLVIDDRDTPLTLADERIARAIRENNARLVIIDPVQAFLGADVDMNRANEVRPIFRSLGDIAQATGCAIVLIGHLNKAAGTQSTYRGLGSIDITAAVRSLLFIGKLKDSPTTRVLIHEKSSLAPPGQSLAFSLGDEKGFEWIGAYDITADELLAGTDTAKTESKTAQAQMLILELLADGKRMPSAELEKTVNERGISSRTMRTAKSRIGDRLVTEKDGTAWVCYLRD